jgi:hypothetical protein
MLEPCWMDTSSDKIQILPHNIQFAIYQQAM